jgi:hypothetical protein
VARKRSEATAPTEATTPSIGGNPVASRRAESEVYERKSAGTLHAPQKDENARIAPNESRENGLG